MKRISLADDLSFSRFIHGFWRLADWNYSNEQTLELIDYSLENGITTFDHADIYGSYTCESLFGKTLSLKPSIREQIEVVTKCGIVLPSKNRPENKSHHYNTSKEHIISSVDQSLTNLQTEYIDVLLIHRPDPFMNPEEVAEAFHLLKKNGKVRYFGVSNFKEHQFNMLQSYVDEDLITNQIEVSAYQLENFEDGTINNCIKNRISPMIWSPLAGGKVFTDTNSKAVRLRQTLEKIANEIEAQTIDIVLYAWLLKHPGNFMPIIGTGKTERIDQAVRSLDYTLSLDQWFEIYQASLGHDVP
ncbi:aldo/keto reductase [Niallia sp. 03133]|uniref:aldo/keto reductase n=1 Tax=Niallia sp. 03133 TaxID=3458060 RepID=UPI0040451598